MTRDNVPVDISVSILMKIKEPEGNSEAVYQLATNVQEINELIDANIAERVRTLARSVNAANAYSLRGEEHANGMLEHMK